MKNRMKSPFPTKPILIHFQTAPRWHWIPKAKKRFSISRLIAVTNMITTPKKRSVFSMKIMWMPHFFCTLSFLQKNTSTVCAMLDGGHTIGNHSSTHPSFPSLSETEMQTEIETVHRYLSKNFSYDCRYFRFPSGIYSEKALHVIAEMGHRSIFWSIAYADWDTENQMPPEEALETLLSRLHPGAVILLHSVSDTNVEILAEFICAARNAGYTFKNLDSYFEK